MRRSNTPNTPPAALALARASRCVIVALLAASPTAALAQDDPLPVVAPAASVALVAPPAPPLPVAPAPPPPQSAFAFGSYGRVIAGTDFKGRPGRDADIVAHGSRLDESNYIELELRREDFWKKTDTSTRLVATLAFAHPVFHYNGKFDAKIAVRNLYLEGRDLGLRGLSLWAGSRMYRGDDIYLLDWWPLDNLNTMGGGVRYDVLKTTYVALQGGLAMPDSPFYLQEVDRPAVLNQLGATKVNVLERQRFIGSAKVSHRLPIGEGGLKFVAYGEAHRVPYGQRETEPRVFEDVPGDGGFVFGAQVGAFTGKRDTHLNLFFRYAGGIAAYGEIGAPDQLSTSKTASGAREVVGALGGNWELGPVGVMAAAYVRSFRNASPDLDFGDVDEGLVMVRPHVFFGELGGIAVEGSYQAQQRGVTTLAAAEGKPFESTGPFAANLWRFGVVPFFSPAGRGDYSRPHFRLIYALTARSDGAKALYPQDDVFSLRGLEHFFGFGAEWWFSSSSYGG